MNNQRIRDVLQEISLAKDQNATALRRPGLCASGSRRLRDEDARVASFQRWTARRRTRLLWRQRRCAVSSRSIQRRMATRTTLRTTGAPLRRIRPLRGVRARAVAASSCPVTVPNGVPRAAALSAGSPPEFVSWSRTPLPSAGARSTIRTLRCPRPVDSSPRRTTLPDGTGTSV
jgi:hypothetical protein